MNSPKALTGIEEKQSVRAPWRAGGLTTFLVAVLFLAACQRPGMLPPAPTPEIVWPPPPAQARIRYIAGITGPSDLGIQAGFIDRIFRYLAGKKQGVLVAPFSVTTDAQGRIYVVDSFLRKVHLFDLPAGKYRLIPTDISDLLTPVAVAVDPVTGNIYVSDSQQAVVKIFDLKGRKAIGELGRDILTRPTGIAIHPVTSELLVVDTRQNTIYRFDLAQGRMLGTLGDAGTDHDPLHFPTHLFAAGDGKVYVTDAMNFRVQVYSGDGRLLGSFGKAGDGRGRFSRPRGVAADNLGRIYVADALFDNIQIFDAQYRLLLALGHPGQGPGEFWLPAGLHIDAKNRIYVADTYNKRIQIFELIKPQELQP